MIFDMGFGDCVAESFRELLSVGVVIQKSNVVRCCTFIGRADQTVYANATPSAAHPINYSTFSATLQKTTVDGRSSSSGDKGWKQAKNGVQGPGAGAKQPTEGSPWESHGLPPVGYPES